MSINDISKKIKSFWCFRIAPLLLKIKSNLHVKEDVFIVITVILIGLAGFGLGKLSTLEKGRGQIEIIPLNSPIISQQPSTSSGSVFSTNIPLSAAAMVASESSQGLLVASKSGKKYHFPWCGGASQISEKNKIWFDTYEEARAAGYTPASNCKGLE